WYLIGVFWPCCTKRVSLVSLWECDLSRPARRQILGDFVQSEGAACPKPAVTRLQTVVGSNSSDHRTVETPSPKKQSPLPDSAPYVHPDSAAACAPRLAEAVPCRGRAVGVVVWFSGPRRI